MSTLEERKTLVQNLRGVTSSEVNYLQQYYSPYLVNNSSEFFEELYPLNHPGSTLIVNNEFTRLSRRVNPANMYRYNSKWYSFRDSVESPDEAFGILQVDDMPYKQYDLKQNMKYFVNRLDIMVFQEYVYPIMLFIDHKFIKWDDIDVVFDSGDTWLVIRGSNLSYQRLKASNVDLIVLPFQCDYVGNETDAVFNAYYAALNEYLQGTLNVDSNGKTTIKIPTLETQYEYNNAIYNIGGWMYSQIKKNHLGVLSSDRVNKLKKVSISKFNYDSYGNVINANNVRFNVLDRDSYLNQALYDKLCYTNYDFYNNEYPSMKFNDDGILDENGKNILCFRSNEYRVRKQHITTKNYIYDNTDINGNLIRNNYFPFVDGLFYDDYKITVPSFSNNVSIHNINETKDIWVYVIYSNYTKEANTLMNKISKQYKDYTISSLVRDLSIATKVNSIDDIDTSRQYEILDLYTLKRKSKEPSEDIYVLYNSHNYDKNVLNKFDVSLDYTYDDKKLYNDIIEECFGKILDFDMTNLLRFYESNYYSIMLTGAQCNSQLNNNYMYEHRRGLKFPRRRWIDHESYCMVFVNGLLHERYSDMIVYQNFFFLPMSNNFNINDHIEIFYYNYVNNNEIKFNISNWIETNKLHETSVDEDYFEASIFEPYIHKEELKIFSHYPKEIIKYPTIIKGQSDNIAFNISYYIDDDKVYIRKDSLPSSTEDKKNIKHVAVSKHKFIYERLYIDQPAYRIKLNSSFRYCNNLEQYALFINGRKMNYDQYLVTVPKHTRPFNDIYLYTSKFVTPEDRIEVFYLPEFINDLNSDNNITLENGYIELDRSKLKVPMNNKLYMVYVNGKKVPQDDLINIDSNTLRVKIDMNATEHVAVSCIARNDVSEYVEYLQNNVYDKYDSIIKFIKEDPDLGYASLDRLFGCAITMSNNEPLITYNVAKIAILNEIVRDWWVTIGYEYNEEPFIYDYETDEYFIEDVNGNYVIPALDGTPEINIKKNYISFLYFYTEPESLYYEIGSTFPGCTINWEYTQRINQPMKIVSQFIDEESIPINARTYYLDRSIDKNTDVTFLANTFDSELRKILEIRFVYSISWGIIDEDSLQYYKRQYKDSYPDQNPNTTDEVQEIYDGSTIPLYRSEKELSLLISRLDKHFIPSPYMKIKDFVIGNNNYFVYAVPTQYILNKKRDEVAIEFNMPDPYSDDVRAHCRDDKVTPIYTDGNLDPLTNTLIKVDKMVMNYMGECHYTNTYGYTARYRVWMSNGFFTRLFDNYGMDIEITKPHIDPEHIIEDTIH